MAKVPTNTRLWNAKKAAAKKKFDVFPSRYASYWIGNEYKKAGGKFKTSKKK
jgi:hypothetical protein